jgi:hypothetical protein
MNNHRNRNRTGILGAVILIVLGVVLLMERNGLISRQLISQWWPLLLVFIGGWLLIARLGRRNDDN